MSETSDRTTVTVTPELRDRLKANRTVKEEPMRKVIDRALDALEGDEPEDAPPSVDLEGMLAELEGPVEYDDLVAACRQALREELPDEVLR